MIVKLAKTNREAALHWIDLEKTKTVKLSFDLQQPKLSIDQTLIQRR